VLRVRLADGSATDLIGWLDQIGPTTLRITPARQPTREVDRSAVLLARRAPAAAGGPPPSRVSAAELEQRALPGWLAYAEPLGDWTLRSAGGFTGRANSCLAVGDPGVPVADAADRIVEYAGTHRIAPMAQVIIGSTEEAALRDLGWTDTYVPVDVLATRLQDFLADRPSPPQVWITEQLEETWLQSYSQYRPNDADPAILTTILDGNPPRAFGTARSGADTIAIARAHTSGDWLGLSAVWTRADQRGRGVATAVMTALGHWAARRGARYCYVQVDQGNPSAQAAYARLGFVIHHGYRYLAPPE
jgi:GNAT superfamily N-acetyltransferase